MFIRAEPSGLLEADRVLHELGAKAGVAGTLAPAVQQSLVIVGIATGATPNTQPRPLLSELSLGVAANSWGALATSVGVAHGMPTELAVGAVGGLATVAWWLSHRG
jgi:hypothetical protein